MTPTNIIPTMGCREDTPEVDRISDLHSGPQGDRLISNRRIAIVPADQRAGFRPTLRVLVIGMLILATAAATRAQDERRSRLPVLGKIAGGSSHQAFSGKVQSVDVKRSLLKVDTVEGGATEFFPLKKNVTVSSASGGKLKIEDLMPGNNVLVYYDQKEDRRTVSQIIVLSSSSEGKEGKAEKDKKKSPPPS